MTDLFVEAVIIIAVIASVIIMTTHWIKLIMEK